MGRFLALEEVKRGLGLHGCAVGILLALSGCAALQLEPIPPAPIDAAPQPDLAMLTVASRALRGILAA